MDFFVGVWQTRGVNRALIVALAGFILVPIAVGAQAPATPRPTPTPSPSPGEATPTFPSQVELVTVDLVATDKKGTPIAGKL